MSGFSSHTSVFSAGFAFVAFQRCFVHSFLESICVGNYERRLSGGIVLEQHTDPRVCESWIVWFLDSVKLIS